MLRSKYFDKLVILCVAVMLMIVAILFHAEDFGIKSAIREPLYVSKLFDDSYVHEIDIEVDDIVSYLKAGEEEYVRADITIDGEKISDVGFRIKGNNSRRLISEYGLIRYSFKIEFDHYEMRDYHGLDKFSLDASFQDNSYMKTYLAYDMFSVLDVPTPLVSYVWLKINGQDFGLYLAIEEMEEAFLRRNYGNDHGALYKPDYRYIDDDNRDLYLIYKDDDIESYPNIFDHAKVAVDKSDKVRVIKALEVLSSGQDLASVIDIDEVVSYFAVSNFLLNWDSYVGYTGHNYYLYEEDGKLSILPWDYNLAFGTYALGMSDPIRDANVLINYPIDTPCTGDVMLKRPLYHEVMKEYLALMYEKATVLIDEYFSSGTFDYKYAKISRMIAPYVKEDPSAFTSYEDHKKALETLKEVIDLRTSSIKGQLTGIYPSKLSEYDHYAITADHIDLRDLGDFDDLKNAKERQDALLISLH